jgi:hypothetical protein
MERGLIIHLQKFIKQKMPITSETKTEIVNKLCKVLEKCCPPMVISKQSDDGMELIGNKKLPYGSTKKLVPGMFFVSVKAGKNMVSFHFFPIYYNENIFEPLAPKMMKYLKGKTCFNFTKPEQVDVKELEALLKRGIELWVKNGYMS